MPSIGSILTAMVDMPVNHRFIALNLVLDRLTTNVVRLRGMRCRTLPSLEIKSTRVFHISYFKPRCISDHQDNMP